MNSMFDVNVAQLREALIKDFRVGLTPMVTSSPGMGKSDIIKDVAKLFNLKVIDLRLSQCEPVDMQGYPGVVNNRMTFFAPEFFPLESDPIPEGYKGWVLFLDEFNSANQQTESAAYRLLLDREVYKYKLHPLCVVVAAGNLITDRAIVTAQSTGTTSRLNHYRLKVDHKLWIEWANSHDIDHRIISFIKFKPNLLHKFDPATSEMTFPCPRTWAFASKVVSTEEKIDKLTKIRLAGTIGEGAAIEFSTYSEIYQNLPTIEQIMNDPRSGWKPPTEPSEQYAITTMLAHEANLPNINKIITAMERLPLDFQIITIKDMYKKTPELKDNIAICDWKSKNVSAMF